MSKPKFNYRTVKAGSHEKTLRLKSDEVFGDLVRRLESYVSSNKIVEPGEPLVITFSCDPCEETK